MKLGTEPAALGHTFNSLCQPGDTHPELPYGTHGRTRASPWRGGCKNGLVPYYPATQIGGNRNGADPTTNSSLGKLGTEPAALNHISISLCQQGEGGALSPYTHLEHPYETQGKTRASAGRGGGSNGRAQYRPAARKGGNRNGADLTNNPPPHCL